MDNEEEKKEDKGEHINLKVKDQVRAAAVFLSRASSSSSSSSSLFFRAVYALSFARERENEISLSFFFQNSIFFFFFSRISLSLLLLLSLTRQSLSAREKQQDNAEVHFKVKMGTKFKKVRNCLRAFRRVPFLKESFFFFSLSFSLWDEHPEFKKRN